MSAAPTSDAMLAEMSACAYRLGKAFAREAEATEDRAEKLELFRLFDRAFFSVRVAIALQLRLKREGGLGRMTADARSDGREAEALEAEGLSDPPERDDRPDRYDERDRDREVERASLPILLKTLSSVCADAAALPGPKPAELPTLVELLAHVDRPPATQGSLILRPTAPRAPGGLRARLTGSATPAPPPAPSGPRLRPRPATGPPRGRGHGAA